MQYRILPTNQRAMPLNCSSKEFVEEYYHCWKDHSRPTDLLYQLVRPFFTHWVQMIGTSTYTKDINYVTLCRRLYPIIENPTKMIAIWANQSLQTTSVQEELEMLFFTRLRNLNYYPKRAAPKMAEYVIAKDFRDRLKDMIVSANRRPIDIPMLAITNSFVTEDIHPDYLLLKNLGLDAWNLYLLELIKLGLSTLQLSALTQIPRKTFSKEEKELWYQLSQKWQQAET